MDGGANHPFKLPHNVLDKTLGGGKGKRKKIKHDVMVWVRREDE